MNRRMVDTALQTLDEVDGVIWLLDAQDKIKQEEERIAETLRGRDAGVDSFEQDRSGLQRKLLPLMERCAQLLPGKEIVPGGRAARRGYAHPRSGRGSGCPKGHRFLPKASTPTSLSASRLGDRARESVPADPRGDSLRRRCDDRRIYQKQEKNLIVIAATIRTERDSHKGILIGKRGAMLKEIGKQAREELKRCWAAEFFSSCSSASIPAGRKTRIC